MYVLVFIVPHVDIELEDNKQFISNIPRNTESVHFVNVQRNISRVERKTGVSQMVVFPQT